MIAAVTWRSDAGNGSGALVRLLDVFGVSPELWLGLQVDYDLRVAKNTTWLKAEPRVRVHAE